MNHRLSHRRAGFTLIELLVVIAIISILASMLFPAFARAREQARKTVCISNLKQIGLGIMQYTQDYDERYPMGYPFFISSKPQESYLVEVVNPYVKSYQIWDCPSFKGRYTETYLGNYGFITSPLNNVIGIPDDPDRTPASLAAINLASEYPLLFCGMSPQQSGADDDPSMNSYLNAHTGLNDRSWDAGGIVGGTSILYADGHAKFLPLDRGKWNTLYSTQR